MNTMLDNILTIFYTIASMLTIETGMPFFFWPIVSIWSKAHS